jgi:hypothetical protein
MLQVGMAALIDMPDVVLLKIFSYLNAEDLAISIPYIDFRWNELSKSPMLWKDITFTPAPNLTESDIIQHLKNMPELRSFRLRHGKHIDMIITAIIAHCKHIRHVVMGWKRGPSQQKVEELMYFFPQMECLEVTIPGSQFNIDFAKLYGNSSNGSTLTMLNRWSSHLLVNEAIPSVTCLPKSEVGIREMLVVRMQDLETLGIACNLTSNIFRTICNCKNLKHLFVCCEVLQTTIEIDIYQLTALNDLESLQLQCLQRCILMSKRSCVFHRLLKLEIVGGGGSVFRSMIISANLIYLNLQDSSFVDENLVDISLCKMLIHLDISDNINLTNKCIEYVAYGCHSLQFLDISYCENMTGDIINILHTCRELQALWMDGLNFIEGNFHKILALFPHLKEISIKHSDVSETARDLKRSKPSLNVRMCFNSYEECGSEDDT